MPAQRLAPKPRRTHPDQGHQGPGDDERARSTDRLRRCRQLCCGSSSSWFSVVRWLVSCRSRIGRQRVEVHQLRLRMPGAALQAGAAGPTHAMNTPPWPVAVPAGQGHAASSCASRRRSHRAAAPARAASAPRCRTRSRRVRNEYRHERRCRPARRLKPSSASSSKDTRAGFMPVSPSALDMCGNGLDDQIARDLAVLEVRHARAGAQGRVRCSATMTERCQIERRRCRAAALRRCVTGDSTSSSSEPKSLCSRYAVAARGSASKMPSTNKSRRRFII